MKVTYTVKTGSLNLSVELYGSMFEFTDESGTKVELEVSEYDMKYLKNRFKEIYHLEEEHV